MGKKVIIVTMNKYPEGDAGAVRQHSFAKIFQKLDCEVIVLGYGSFVNKKKQFDGVDYYSMRSKSNNILVRAINRFCTPLKINCFLHGLQNAPDIIMVVDVLPTAFKVIEKYAYNNNSILIHDSVEWYSAEEFTNGDKNYEYRLKEYTNTKAIHFPWKVISISKYLDNHFNALGAKSIRIPVIMDTESILYNCECRNEKITFVYAGSPGLKDYLKDMIDGFALLSDVEILKININIVGVTKQQLIDQCMVSEKSIKRLGESLNAIGRVEREVAKKYVMDADYSVLLRDEEMRYAKAGFPTKFVESLSSGTPVICNLSSDIGMYLEDEVNGLIVAGHSSEDFCNAIRRSMCIPSEKLEEMKISARKTAEQYFDYKNYITAINNLIQEI